MYVLACIREIYLEYSQPGNEVHFVSANIVTQRTMFISGVHYFTERNNRNTISRNGTEQMELKF